MADLRNQLAAAILACVASLAHGAAPVSVPIVNAGFEALALPDGGSNFGNGTAVVPSWNMLGLGGGGGGTFDVNVSPAFPAGTAPEGENVAYAAAAALLQTLTATLQAGDYTISVWIGNPADRRDSDNVAGFEVWVPSTGRIIAGRYGIVPGVDVPNGIFVPFGVTGTVMHSHPDIGLPIGVRLLAPGGIISFGGYQTFDDVRLTFAAAPVPEPGTYTLMLIGLGVLVWGVRRHK